MATRKQVSDTSHVKSIQPTKEKCRYLCSTNMQEYTNTIVVLAYSMSLFLIKLNFRKQINCYFFITRHKEFRKRKESDILNKKHVNISRICH